MQESTHTERQLHWEIPVLKLHCRNENSMYNFLRLKSLRIPVIPGAGSRLGSAKSLPDCLGRQADRLTNQRSTTAWSRSQAASKKGKRHIEVFAKGKHGQCAHLHGMNFPPVA